jgi:nucleoside 2-deoxyribosyltransferase
MNRSVYLAGPIAGLTSEQAREWRRGAAGYLRNYGIEAYDPLDGPAEKGSITLSAQTPRGILAQNLHYCTRAGIILCNFTGATRVSIGSIMECAWAFQLRKPLVVVADDHHDHEMLNPATDFSCEGLDEALHVVRMLLAA